MLYFAASPMLAGYLCAMAENTETLEIGLEKTDIRVAEAKLVWVPVA